MTKKKPGPIDDKLITEGMALQAEAHRRLQAAYPQLRERPLAKKVRGLKARVSAIDAQMARLEFQRMTAKKPKGQGLSRADALAGLAARFNVSVSTMENVILQRRTYAAKMKK
jgi:hypothetical protein